MNYSAQALITFFGWCSVINIVLLLLSTVTITCCKSFISRFHSRLFNIPEDTLANLYFQYLANYKLAVLVFNLIPYLVLKFLLNE